jgi:hypothetical protein
MREHHLIPSLAKPKQKAENVMNTHELKFMEQYIILTL